MSNEKEAPIERNLEEAIRICKEAEAERAKKQEELALLTIDLLSFDSESLGDALKCCILNEGHERLSTAALKAFMVISRIRMLESEY